MPKMGEETKYHYATDDAEQVAAFKAWGERRKEWGASLEAVAKRLGREPVEAHNYGGTRFFAFTLKPGESRAPSAWKDTPWVLTDGGFLRPRASTSAGKRLQAEMDALGTLPHPAEALRGVPKMAGFLGRPGIMLSPDGKTLVVTYSEPVKHDARWRPLKTSDYWLLREAQEAAA